MMNTKEIVKNLDNPSFSFQKERLDYFVCGAMQQLISMYKLNELQSDRVIANIKVLSYRIAKEMTSDDN